jgi:hypothetical protein
MFFYAVVDGDFGALSATSSIKKSTISFLEVK